MFILACYCCASIQLAHPKIFGFVFAADLLNSFKDLDGMPWTGSYNKGKSIDSLISHNFVYGIHGRIVVTVMSESNAKESSLYIVV